MRRSFASVRRASLLPELLAVASLLMLVTGLIRWLTPKEPEFLPAAPRIINLKRPEAPLPVALPLAIPAPEARPITSMESDS